MSVWACVCLGSGRGEGVCHQAASAQHTAHSAAARTLGGLDDDVRHAVANGGRGGGVAQEHLFGKLHVRALHLVVVLRCLGEALEGITGDLGF